ncbi:MAG: glycoside-pentoside-hexuronide (GPH):cation symporter [Bacilli bacterium]|nr:glycoside-pentoside-hexuronide (GPH):cation symporter [Bacilli bacterium]
MEQEIKKDYFKRNKWAYSLGGIGRDMSYTLVASFFITYIQFAGLGLSVAQFSVISMLLIAGRVWDAVNDPIMGTIIENTKSRWGKFKPWILLGAVLTGIVVVLMFNYRPLGNNGWNFVIFFGIIYLLWEITYTMNDISYWSMLPSITTDTKRRNSITTLAVVFAGVGAFAANAIIMVTTTGNAVKGYALISIIIAIFLILCQALTVFGVKQPKIEIDESEEKITIPKMIKVIKNNDQLLWVVLAMLLYNVGSGIFIGLGYNFIYIELGYDGTLALIFIASFGVSNIGIQTLYPRLANKFGRKKLVLYSFIAIAVGYSFMLLLGFVPFLPINIITIVIFGVIVFAGQAIIYMILTINITNTVEYNQYKTNERNEAVIFSLRPFMAKFGSALQQGIVALVLIISGIYTLSGNINFLESQKHYFDDLTQAEQTEYKENITNRIIIFDTEEFENLTQEEKEHYYDILENVTFSQSEGKEVMEIKAAADNFFKNEADIPMRLILRASITILPILFIFFTYAILTHKFKIDEKMYEDIIADIKSRN